MRKLILNIDESRYRLFLQFLQTLDYVKIISPADPSPKNTPKYDFTDLAGKLKWNGDALAEQRRLRDEW